MDLRQLREVVGVTSEFDHKAACFTFDALEMDYCDECVAETLHYRDETDGMWTCASCGRWA